MYTGKILLAACILWGLIIIMSAIPPVHETGTSSSKPNQLFVAKGDNLASAQEATIDVNGINIGGVNESLIVFLTAIGTLVGMLTTLFLLFIAWRVLTVFEKLSTTFDQLLQQKIADKPDGEDAE